MIAAILAFGGKLPWAQIGLGAVLLGIIGFAIHSYGDSRQAKGEAKITAEWNKAIKAEEKATAQAQTEIHASALQTESVRVEKVATSKKIVADATEALQNTSDEEKSCSLARAAIYRLRVGADLPVSDVAPTPS